MRHNPGKSRRTGAAEPHPIQSFHYQNLRLATQTIYWPVLQRHFSNVTVPCHAKLFSEIQAKIREFCEEILERAQHQHFDTATCEKVIAAGGAAFPYFDFGVLGMGPARCS